MNEDLTRAGWNKLVPYMAAFFVFSYSMIDVGVVMKDVRAAFIGTGLLIFFLLLYFIFYHKKKE